MQIKSGYIDVRKDEATGRVCMVFGMRGEELRLFRVFSAEEFDAFCQHIERLRNQW